MASQERRGECHQAGPMSDVAWPVSRHCPGSATLSALSRRHSADRHGDDTVTTQLELSSTTTTTFITISHHSPDTTWSCCSDKTALIFTTSLQPPEVYLIVSILTPLCISSLHFSFFSRPLPGPGGACWLPRCFQY